MKNKYSMSVLDTIKSLYSEYLIFLAFSGIGDICYCFSFLEEIKNKSGKKILVLTGKYTSELIECYPCVDKVIILEKESIEDILKNINIRDYQIVFGKFAGKDNIYSCSALEKTDYLKLKIGEENYNSIIRRVIFGKSKNIKYTYPKITISNLQFSDNNYKKTVIINPYSNTLETKDYKLYENITYLLSQKGYTVYTNTVGDQPAINGTKRLLCSISDFYYLSGVVKLVISLRTGLIDFSINSGGNFVVLYTDHWNGYFKKAYDLNGWQAKSNIYQYDISNENEIIRKVLEICSR